METTDRSEWIITHIPCPDCGSSDGRSINSNYWSTCFVCKANKKVDPETLDETDTPRPAPTKAAAGLLTDLEFLPLEARKITQETCRKFGYGIGEFKGDPVHVAPYIRDGSVVAQKLRTADKKFVVLGDGKALPLFGQHLWSAKGRMVIVTEGEIDCLTVSQLQGNKWPVVSLPTGAPNAAKTFAQNLEWFDGFEKVIIMFDQDEAGQAGAQAAAEVLPPGKAFIASLPLKDPNECLKAGKGEAVIQAIWNAAPWRPDAILDGSSLLERMRSYKGPTGIPWPWEGLNQMCRVIQYPAITLIVAGTGSGKTTFCRALEHHLINAGENVGILHLEEDVVEAAMGIVAHRVGKRLDLDPSLITEAELEEAFNASSGRPGVYFYDHFGSNDVDTIISKIRFLAKACKCRYVVLDHLSIVVSGLDITDERKAIDVTMTRLRTLVQETGIGLILVNHLGTLEGKSAEQGAAVNLRNIRGSRAIGQLVDVALSLERDQQATGGAQNISLVRVLKNRKVGKTGPACKLLYDETTGRHLEVPLTFGEEDAKGDEFDGSKET